LGAIARELVRSTDITRLIAFKDLAELLSELEAAVIVQRIVLEFTENILHRGMRACVGVGRKLLLWQLRSTT
jgi:hypothetical protein